MFSWGLGAETGGTRLKEDPHESRLADFAAAAHLVVSRTLDVRPYITSTVALDDVPATLEAIDAGADHVKTQIDPTR